jgi:tetratricopeptide (TPR) repeat protein
LSEQRQAKAHKKQAREEFTPVLEMLGEAGVSQGYDIDKTIRIIHAIDLAVEEKSDIGQYLEYLARQDYRGVASDVTMARKQFMEVLLRLYERQIEVKHQQSFWRATRSLILQGMSMARPLGVYVDNKQAKRLLDDIRREEKELRADVSALEAELIRLLMEYSKIYYHYVEEWDKLCLVRDHAYLAINRGDWQEAIVAAQKAIAAAPHDTESPLLLAMASIEEGTIGQQLQIQGREEYPGEPGPEDHAAVARLLGSYLAEHPQRSAPALLLKGNLLRSQGDTRGAVAAYEDAAKQYPSQADALTDRLDPYRARSYLRKTREGRYVIERYSSMMQGAGYFSPDLQMARLYFDTGDMEQGRRHVINHFARRRTQQQWSFVLSDIRYCNDVLGAYFNQMFPEMSFIELLLKRSWIGGEMVVSVENRSNTTLHNCTLLLCINFTDMYEDDYEPFVVGDTQPALAAGETVEFGTVEVELALFGKDKGLDDVVASRAIMIANEAVLWVDTGDYREQVVDSRAGTSGYPEGESPLSHQALEDALTGCEVTVTPGFGKDDITIRLPSALAAIMPVFRLEVDQEELSPAKSYIKDDWIVLEFPDATSFDDEGVAMGSITLAINSRTSNHRLTLVSEGGTYSLLVDSSKVN